MVGKMLWMLQKIYVITYTILNPKSMGLAKGPV